MSDFNQMEPNAGSETGRRASGFRHETPASVHWRAISDAYKGPPREAAHPHQLLDALRQARSCLKLTDSELALITDLYAATQPRDWEVGRRPMAWPSNDTLASRQGKSISAIQRMIARLIERGLIVMRESPTGKRYGYRGPDGHVTKAYGFDLSLLAIRYVEFRAIATAREAQQAAIRSWRTRATLAKKRLIATIEAAEECGLWTSFWETAEAKVVQLTAPLSKLRDIARLEILTLALEALLTEVLDVFKAATSNPSAYPQDTAHGDDEEPDPRPAHRVSATLKNTTDPLSNISCNKAHQDCNPAAGGQPYSEFERATVRRQQERGDPLKHVEPDRLLSEIHEFSSARDEEAAGWHGLALACAKLRLRYEISHRLWDEAEERVGPRMALAIFAIMVARGRDHYTSPGGCFRRMIERHEAGTLNLLPSYFGLLSKKPDGEPSGPNRDARSLGAIARKLKGLV